MPKSKILAGNGIAAPWRKPPVDWLVMRPSTPDWRGGSKWENPGLAGHVGDRKPRHDQPNESYSVLSSRQKQGWEASLTWQTTGKSKATWFIRPTNLLIQSCKDHNTGACSSDIPWPESIHTNTCRLPGLLYYLKKKSAIESWKCFIKKQAQRET